MSDLAHLALSHNQIEVGARMRRLRRCPHTSHQACVSHMCDITCVPQARRARMAKPGSVHWLMRGTPPQVVPEGLFPNLTRITKLELDHNNIHALPSDISTLQ